MFPLKNDYTRLLFITIIIINSSLNFLLFNLFDCYNTNTVIFHHQKLLRQKKKKKKKK